jgi:ribA/ribD-fused uncharacterized protein
VSFDPVLFYGHRSGQYRSFSNWYPVEFTHDGHTFRNSEQAMMYYKSNDPVYRRQVLRTANPAEVKALGRRCEMRRDWDNAKYSVVWQILMSKFGQNEDIREVLLSTGDRSIHEDCNDPWWGGGPNHRGGRDLLGKALMDTRETLRRGQ